MKTLQIGIASYDQMKVRTLAIVRGEYKRHGRNRLSGFPRSKASPRCSLNAIRSC